MLEVILCLSTSFHYAQNERKSFNGFNTTSFALSAIEGGERGVLPHLDKVCLEFLIS